MSADKRPAMHDCNGMRTGEYQSPSDFKRLLDYIDERHSIIAEMWARIERLRAVALAASTERHRDGNVYEEPTYRAIAALLPGDLEPPEARHTRS